MESKRSLVSLGQGQRAGISAVGGDEAMRRRLMELGFVPGADARRLFSSPGGGMAAYFIRGAVIALRDEDAEKVGIIP